MTYRDTFQKCPRCGVELVDARSARGCSQCGGMWVAEAVLHEMLLEMLPPGRVLGVSPLVARATDTPPLPCPACATPMDPVGIADVSLDRCASGHGVWFDARELGGVLYRVGQPDALATPVQARSTVPVLAFLIQTPGQPDREQRFAQEIVKLGRGSTSHVVLDDKTVARMHAVLEVSDGLLHVIDLGSRGGTLVNGQRVTKAQLRDGDQLGLGTSTLTVRLGGS